MKTQNASTSSVLDLRRRLLDALPAREQAVLNIVDALTVGPRIRTPSELASSPMFAYALPALYSTVRSLAERTPSRHRAQRRALTRVLKQLRRARDSWLDAWAGVLGLDTERIGPWRVFVLDATPAPRPKAQTVRRGFAHGSDGMRPGHALSVLSQRCGPGAWTLPLEIEVVPVEQRPAAFGAQQIVDFILEHGWEPDDLLAVDADYTKVPTLKPIVSAGANVLGRISGRRCLFRPPPPRTGRRGRPAVRGAKIKLWDQRTLPDASREQTVTTEDGRRFEISCWDDVRMRQWSERSMTLYRVIEYRRDGSRRYRRPMWLIYVGHAQAPTPEQARSAYGARFGVEHSFRFLKGELGLAAGQFSSTGAIERLGVWVELVATAMWQCLALRADLMAKVVTAPGPVSTERLTPGAVRRAASAIFLQLGIGKPSPTLRGKSPGRAKGTRFEPRKRYRLFRKRKRRKAA